MKHDLIAKDFVLYVVHHFASMQTWSKEDIIAEIERKIKEADEDIVRCRDCKYYADGDCFRLELSRPDDFCSYGERKEK